MTASAQPIAATSLGTLAGSESTPTAVNTAGDIVGFSTLANGEVGAGQAGLTR